jgi:hypothetical protein
MNNYNLIEIINLLESIKIKVILNKQILTLKLKHLTYSYDLKNIEENKLIEFLTKNYNKYK